MQRAIVKKWGPVDQTDPREGSQSNTTHYAVVEIDCDVSPLEKSPEMRLSMFWYALLALCRSMNSLSVLAMELESSPVLLLELLPDDEANKPEIMLSMV